MECKKCSVEIKEGEKFCHNCGTKIDRPKVNIMRLLISIILIIIILLVVIVSKIFIFNITKTKPYLVKTSSGTTKVLNINNKIIDNAVDELKKENLGVSTTTGVVFRGNSIKFYVIAVFNPIQKNYCSFYTIDSKTGKVNQVKDAQSIKISSLETDVLEITQKLSKGYSAGVYTDENAGMKDNFFYEDDLKELQKKVEKYVK